MTRRRTEPRTTGLLTRVVLSLPPVALAGLVVSNIVLGMFFLYVATVTAMPSTQRAAVPNLVFAAVAITLLLLRTVVGRQS